MTHSFEIQNPIWKNRSVGLNLMNIDPNDDIEVRIMYVKKGTGLRLWPSVYTIRASQVNSYPVQKIGAVELHIVPIKDLKIKKNNNNSSNTNQKQTNMLFDNKEIEKIRKDNSERSGNDTRKTIEAGEALVTQGNSRIEKSKKDSAPMIVVEFLKSPDYKPITAYWKLSGAGDEIGKSRLVAHLENAFNYIIQPCKDENDVLKQLKQFDGKSLKIAVRHKDSLWDNKKGETIVVTKAEYWYSGASNDNNFHVEPAKILVALDEKEMKRYNEITELTGHSPRKAGEKSTVTQEEKTIQQPVRQTEDIEDDGLPF